LSEGAKDQKEAGDQEEAEYRGKSRGTTGALQRIEFAAWLWKNRIGF